MSGWFQEKSGEATKAASETGQTIQDRAVEAKDQAGSFLGEKTQAVTMAASDTVEAGKKLAGDGMGKVSETAQAGTDCAVESKDQTGGFFGGKTEDAKKAAVETADAANKAATDAADAAKKKADETAQYVKADSPVVPKDTGNVFQQAGGQVMGAAGGAKDAVMNTLGLGGDAAK
ncbi:unnamed protein product [Alopecurus aequalis]